MDNWLSRVLTDISKQHTISAEKAKLLFNGIISMLFMKDKKQNAELLDRGKQDNGVKRVN